jgi:hypothetical protein
MQHLLRNKIVTSIISLGILLPYIGKAQLRNEINLEDHDDQKFHFGISLGVNQSHYGILHSSRFLGFDSVNVIESVNSTGVNLAGLVNMRLTNHLDIRTYPINLVFTEKVFQYTLKTPDLSIKEDSITSKKVQGISLSLPFHLKFSSERIDNFKVFVLAGGRLDYDLAANAGKKNNDDALTLKKFDYAAEAGIGFHFYFPVFVLTPELKITYGLRNVLSNDTRYKYANTIDQINSRAITLSLTVE